MTARVDPRPPAGVPSGARTPAIDLQGATVLVTGSSGFVGSAVARALQHRGAQLRLLVRPSSPRTNLSGLDADVRLADLRDPSAVREAFAGCRYAFHVAADYRLWARDPEEIVRNNRAATESVIAAAAEAGIERLVYTSSVATLRLRPGATPADESGALDEAEAIGAYKRSKVVAERLVERAVREQGLPAVIVCPSTPIGPHDVRPTPTGRIIVEAASGRIPAYVDTGLNLVHVDDVAEGHLLALAKGRTGERYILGGQDATLSELLATIAQFAGRKAPRLKLPLAPLYPLAEVAEAIGRVTGREPFLTRDALKMAERHMFFSSAKAERELEYEARPYAEGVRDALAWFRAGGYIR